MTKEETLIEAAAGAIKKRKRRGRGNASGLGGECGRGHKGQKSRSGFKSKPGFEGGQTPLYRRLPKRKGFLNRGRVIYMPVNLTTLEAIFDDNTEVTVELLVEKGIVKKNDKIKILGHGDLTKKLVIHAHAISNSAQTKIEKSGATFFNLTTQK